MSKASKHKAVSGIAFTVWVALFPTGVAIIATGRSLALGWMLIGPSCVALGVAIWFFRQWLNESREEAPQEEKKSIPSPSQNITQHKPQISKEIEGIFFAMKVNRQVLGNHGHRDDLRIDAELKDGRTHTEILDGNCGICGKPRSKRTLKTWRDKSA